jgi:glutamine amidotransferase
VSDPGLGSGATAGGSTPARATRIAVVDYGAGNLVSIEQALLAVGAAPTLVRDPDGLAEADAVIVPGVGAAEPAMRRLDRAGLVGALTGWVASGRPYLGICLGLQLLFEASDEDGAITFGVLPGRAVRLRGAPTLPHIGWNQVVPRRRHAIFDGITDGADFYFVHSYAGLPSGPDADRHVLADTEHGQAFASVVEFGNVLGVQFHPERSGHDGLRLLANFARLATVRPPETLRGQPLLSAAAAPPVLAAERA